MGKSTHLPAAATGGATRVSAPSYKFPAAKHADTLSLAIGLAYSSELRCDRCHSEGISKPPRRPSRASMICDAQCIIVFAIHPAAPSISRAGSEALCRSNCVTSRESRCTL
jgi:MoaA/NifB/PqqE/SkfB family radical SAM enzyme